MNFDINVKHNINIDKYLNIKKNINIDEFLNVTKDINVDDFILVKKITVDYLNGKKAINVFWI